MGKLKLIVLFLMFGASVSCASIEMDIRDFLAKLEREHFTPKLNLICPDQTGQLQSREISDTDMLTIDANNLVVIVHGWIEQLDWPEDLAKEIYRNVDSNDWTVAWYDWRAKAIKITPTLAAEYGRDNCGPDLAGKILNFNGNFKHIHLIGHSAGSWIITQAGKSFWDNTNANLHLTFLDAYIPYGWDVNDIGLTVSDPNKTYWSDHYYTKDITWFTTESILPNCHNIDLSEIDPGVNDHLLPAIWYHATIVDKYTLHWFYKHHELFSVANRVHYGFDLTLEAGRDSWEKAQKLELGDKVKITRPQVPGYNRFDRLF